MRAIRLANAPATSNPWFASVGILPGDKPEPCRIAPIVPLGAALEDAQNERFLTTEEFRRLDRALREAEGGIWLPAVPAIRLLMLTGCRKNEILKLR